MHKAQRHLSDATSRLLHQQVCAKCQNAADAWVEDFSDWSKNCAKHDVASFAPGAPDGVIIPEWATGGNIAGPWNLDTLKNAAGSPPAEEKGTPPQPALHQEVIVPLKLDPGEKKEEPTTESEPPVPPEPQNETKNETPNGEKAGEANGTLAEIKLQAEPEHEPAPKPEPETENTAVPEAKIPKEAQVNQAEPGSVTSAKERSSSATRTSPATQAQLTEPTSTSDSVEGTSDHAPIATGRRGGDKGRESGPADLVEASTQDNAQAQVGRPNLAGYMSPGKLELEENEEDEDAPYAPPLIPSVHHESSDPESNRGAMNPSQQEAGVNSPSRTADEAWQPTVTTQDSTIANDMREETLASLTQEQGQVAKLEDPTELERLSSEMSIGTAAELLVAQPTAASGNKSPLPNEEEDFEDGEVPAGRESIEGSLDHSTSNADEIAAAEPGEGRYQYSGDPGVAVAKDEGKENKAKIAAICVTVLALLVLGIVYFKLFMCFRKRKAEDDDRESWMEPDSDTQEKFEVGPSCDQVIVQTLLI